MKVTFENDLLSQASSQQNCVCRVLGGEAGVSTKPGLKRVNDLSPAWCQFFAHYSWGTFCLVRIAWFYLYVQNGRRGAIIWENIGRCMVMHPRERMPYSSLHVGFVLVQAIGLTWAPWEVPESHTIYVSYCHLGLSFWEARRFLV